jgi:hypothetical protein
MEDAFEELKERYKSDDKVSQSILRIEDSVKDYL